MYILALNGSPNFEGNTAYILDGILKICEENGAQIEMLNLHKIMSSLKQPFCTVCSNPCSGVCYKDSLLEEAFKKVDMADGLLFGSPVYFGGVTAQFKAFFDKSRKVRATKRWIGKPAGAVSVGASKYGGQEAVLKSIHDIMLVEGLSIVGDGHEDFDAGHHGVAAQRPADKDVFASNRIKVMAARIFDEAKKYESFKKEGKG